MSQIKSFMSFAGNTQRSWAQISVLHATQEGTKQRGKEGFFMHGSYLQTGVLKLA